MKVVLISTYELGRQPFGLASPTAWLRARGHDVVCADLARIKMPAHAIAGADLIGFYLPMHTATRLALPVLERARALNPAARICCFGLYAPVNAELLRKLGANVILGGEFESDLARVADGLPAAAVSERLTFVTPDRSSLPPLMDYARLVSGGEQKVVGYTEASRGCKHLCRHCPIVPVYQGTFRIVQREVVLADIRQQVAAGARHITFGDPDFFNGPGHAIPLVEALRAEHPALTYDVTIKVEHLLKHADLLPVLKRTGCLFVTSAVESLDDAVLAKLEKGHTRLDFFDVVRLTREAGLTLAPTFVAFTPWTTRESYAELLDVIADLDLIENVAPIQFAIRLLIPAGSRLLELQEIRDLIGPFDERALSYKWQHSLDPLCSELQKLIRREEQRKSSRGEIFRRIQNCAVGRAVSPVLPSRATIPYLTEPWYC